MPDLLGPLDKLRTQLGTLVHQEILRNTPAGSQYVRLWWRRQELSADDWGAQELELAPDLQLASVLRPWQSPEPVLVTKLSARRCPQNLKY
jgi:hypothetical protein